MSCWYEILECQPDSSREEIKKNFHRLVRSVHPDTKTRSTHDTDDERKEKIHLIYEAWQVLGNDESRRLYDQQLMTFKATNFEIVDLDDLPYDDTNQCFDLKCRCGNKISIYEYDLDEGIELYVCNTCSLRYKLQFAVVER